MVITNAVYETINTSLSTRIDVVESKTNELRAKVRTLLSELMVVRNRGLDVPDAMFTNMITEINSLVTEIKNASTNIEYYGEDTMTRLATDSAALQAAWDAVGGIG